MSDRQKNQALIVLGIITYVCGFGSTLIKVGSLKGEIISKVNEHTKQLDSHAVKIDSLHDDVTDLKVRIHGVASQAGKVPGRVAAKIENNVNHNPE